MIKMDGKNGYDFYSIELFNKACERCKFYVTMDGDTGCRNSDIIGKGVRYKEITAEEQEKCKLNAQYRECL